jgi:acetolactate synthase-1/2/3 large subunit
VVLPPHEPEIEALLARAELAIVVGSELDAITTKNQSIALPDELVVANVRPDPVTVKGRTVWAVAGDARWALDGLRRRTAARAVGLSTEAGAVCDAVWARLRADGRTADATALVDIVGRVARGRAVVVNDMAVPGYWLAGYYATAGPRQMQYPLGWGTLGYALPASVGAAPGSGGPVLAVCGDGGFAFAVGELATIAQERLSVTILVVDDGGYGMLRFDQRNDPEVRGVDLWGPDYVALARSYRIEATGVDGVGPDLEKALGDALESGGPRLVHCRAALFPPKTTSPRWDDP